MRRLVIAAVGVVALGAPWAQRAHAAEADAQKLYQRHCKSCHGADGTGNAGMAATLKVDPKLLNLARPESAKIPREKKREALLKGKDQMPGYEDKLKPDQVEPVLDYAQKLADAAKK